MPQAPSFIDYMGDMKLYIDALLDSRDGSEGGSEIIGTVSKWQFPSNWKFGAENFLGDHYHGISHRSEILVGTGPGGPGTERHGGSSRVPRAGSGGMWPSPGWDMVRVEGRRFQVGPSSFLSSPTTRR